MQKYLVVRRLSNIMFLTQIFSSDRVKLYNVVFLSASFYHSATVARGNKPVLVPFRIGTGTEQPAGQLHL